jgi:hypothetical protein
VEVNDQTTARDSCPWLTSRRLTRVWTPVCLLVSRRERQLLGWSGAWEIVPPPPCHAPGWQGVGLGIRLAAFSWIWSEVRQFSSVFCRDICLFVVWKWTTFDCWCHCSAICCNCLSRSFHLHFTQTTSAPCSVNFLEPACFNYHVIRVMLVVIGWTLSNNVTTFVKQNFH